MKKLLITLFTVGFLALPAVFALQLKNGDAVALFGDTIFGCGQHGMGCVALYFDGIKNAGIKIKELRVSNSWYLAPDMMKMYQERVLPKKPSVIILNFGQSDVLRNTPDKAYQDAMRALVKVAKADKMTPVLVSIMPMGEDPSTKNNKKFIEYNTFLKQLAAEEGCEYWDAFNYLMTESAALRKVYPNWKGNFFMGGHLFNPDGDRALAKFMLSKSGITADQIAASCAEWDKRSMGLRVDMPVNISIQLIDAANAKGMTDSEYISELVKKAK